MNIKSKYFKYMIHKCKRMYLFYDFMLKLKVNKCGGFC